MNKNCGEIKTEMKLQAWKSLFKIKLKKSLIFTVFFIGVSNFKSIRVILMYFHTIFIE